MMDVESPAQGSETGDIDVQKSAITTVSMGAKTSGFRHHLPQIPKMTAGHKIAQSKASARQEAVICTAAAQPTETAKIHVEGSNKIVEISGTGRQEEIFTPPETESSSNSSPGEEAKTSNKNGGSAMDRYGDMTGTPIKLRIRRANRDGELDLSSCIDEAPPQNTGVNSSLNLSTSSSSSGMPRSPGGAMPDALSPGSHDRSERKVKGKRGRKKRGIGSISPRIIPLVKKSAEDAKDRLPKWLVGDLVWAKVSGHPWWPCMISYDPYEKIYTKLRHGKSYIRMYHVQFFGDEAERGWVSESATLLFEGKKQLEDYFKSMQLKVHAKQRALYKLDASTRRKRAWDVAWKSAEEALPLTKMERKQKYTFSYVTPVSAEAGESKDLEEASSEKPAEEDTGTGRTKTKAKLKKALITARTSRMQGQGSSGGSVGATEDSTLNGVSVSKRGRKRKLSRYLEQESDEEEPEETSPPRRKQKKAESVDGDDSVKKSHRTASLKSCDGSFEVFRQKHCESVLSDHPEFDEETLTDYLQQQWKMMDPKRKSRYRSKFASSSDQSPTKKEAASTTVEQNPSNKDGCVVKRSGRVSKPSAKKIEAEQDGKLLPEGGRRLSSKNSVGEDEEREEGEEMEEEMRETLAGVDDVIDSVVAGAGTMPIMKEPLPMEAEPPQKPKRRNKKVESVRDTEQDSDAASETMSEPGGPSIIQTGEEACDVEINKLSSAGPPKKENICLMCENVGELVQCEGPCGGSFHTDCLGLGNSGNSAFKCDECSTGLHSCFSCKEASTDTKRCSVPQCGRYYHEACVKKYQLTRQENRGFICPLHSCATCAAENPKGVKATKGRLFRCVRCPVAYHLGDFCIAAGSIPLAGYNIVCSRHFQPIKTQKHHSHVNVSWCFICNKGGTLLCCESCPAAFHETCLKIEQPEGNWYCRDCTAGKRPLYGDVIWVKLGNYRWWPGEICHPKNVPRNIQEKAHQVGEFPVKFLGSNDYFWIHQGRVFLFQEGDKGTRDTSSTKGLAKIFAKAVQEGTHAFKLWKDAKENKAHQEVMKNDKKPAPYKHIKANIPCGNVQINKPDLAQLPRCECKPDQDHPCGPDSECFNRMLLFECHPVLCPAGDKCRNQRFQKRQYPDCEVFRTVGRGWGLKTLVDIKKGEFVNEYVGELVDDEECARRIEKAHEENITNFYMLTIEKNRIIDAGPKGNYSRFMNHSCQPNLDTHKWTINGEVRVGLFAAQDIAADTELMFNYNLDCLGNEKTACSCGAPICSGFLGVRPKTSAAVANEKRAKEIKKKKKRKVKVDVKKEHEDECFRCGEGGELVMCDKKSCPKVYHLQCLNLAKPPHGKWTCPWHHCDQCGKLAVQLCSHCPNSFCRSHLEGAIFQTPEGKLICSDHEDLLSMFAVTKVDPSKIKEESVEKDSESPATDSDSLVSSEESEKLSELAESEVPVKDKGKKSHGRKSESVAVTESPCTETAVAQTSRTGRKIKKRTPDYLDANDSPTLECKPKRMKVTKTTKTVNAKSKTKTDSTSSGSLEGVAEMFSEVDNSVVRDSMKAPPRVSAVKDEQMFDDSDEDGFGGLVIDIPTV